MSAAVHVAIVSSVNELRVSNQGRAISSGKTSSRMAKTYPVDFRVLGVLLMLLARRGCRISGHCTNPCMIYRA